MSMFKDGRKAYDSASSVTLEFVKQRVIQDKSSNLEWVVETVFDLPRHKEELIIYNLNESEINWEVNVPFDQNNTSKLTGTLIDSLNIPIEFSMADITTSFVFEDKLETRFWYSENNDTTIVIPFSINIDVVNVSIDVDNDLLLVIIPPLKVVLAKT